MIKFARYTYQGSEKTKIGLVLMSQTRFSAYSPLRRFYTFFYKEAFYIPIRKKASRQATDLRIRGANGRTRTGDLRITSALLYQLSHVGIECCP